MASTGWFLLVQEKEISREKECFLLQTKTKLIFVFRLLGSGRRGQNETVASYAHVMWNFGSSKFSAEAKDQGVFFTISTLAGPFLVVF